MVVLVEYFASNFPSLLPTETGLVLVWNERIGLEEELLKVETLNDVSLVVLLSRGVLHVVIGEWMELLKL